MTLISVVTQLHHILRPYGYSTPQSHNHMGSGNPYQNDLTWYVLMTSILHIERTPERTLPALHIIRNWGFCMVRSRALPASRYSPLSVRAISRLNPPKFWPFERAFTYFAHSRITRSGVPDIERHGRINVVLVICSSSIVRFCTALWDCGLEAGRKQHGVLAHFWNSRKRTSLSLVKSVCSLGKGRE